MKKVILLLVNVIALSKLMTERGDEPYQRKRTARGADPTLDAADAMSSHPYLRGVAARGKWAW